LGEKGEDGNEFLGKGRDVGEAGQEEMGAGMKFPRIDGTKVVILGRRGRMGMNFLGRDGTLGRLDRRRWGRE
jgi:hypothetical protein